MSKEHASAFMINEIHEQPDLLSEIIDHHTGSTLTQLQLLKSELSTERLNSFENVLILGLSLIHI